jgi:hypothetical protein
MNVKIKVNQREPESLKRFYVTLNDKVVQAHLTYEQAQALKERLKNKAAK